MNEKTETCKADCKKHQAYNSASECQTPIPSQLLAINRQDGQPSSDASFSTDDRWRSAGELFKS